MITSDLEARARQLGRELAAHPSVLRLKRLEEIIREDPALAATWADLEGAEKGEGGCGSGGCGSGGCGSKEVPEGGRRAGNGGPKPGSRMDLYRSFSDSSVLQEYVQVRQQVYSLVDSVYAGIFEAMYGRFDEFPEVSPGLAAPPVGFAGLSLIDPLPDEDAPEGG